MPGGRGPAYDADKHGLEFWWTQPSIRPWLMQTYGYVEAQLKGIWVVGFEASSPEITDGSYRRCWLSGIGDAQIESSLGVSRSLQDVPVVVVGHISPPGAYGHRNLYGRQVYATKIARDRGQPLPAPDSPPPDMPLFR